MGATSDRARRCVASDRPGRQREALNLVVYEIAARPRGTIADGSLPDRLGPHRHAAKEGAMTTEADADAERPIIMIWGTLVGLGPLDRRHIPLYLRWMNDPEVTRGLSRSGPFTREMEESWFERVSTNANGVPFTIYELESLRPIGTAGLHDINRHQASAGFGISIGEKDCWNRGYGTEATRLTLDYAFNVLDLKNVMLAVYSFNPRAQRAYEKAGFRVIGRRRQLIPLAGQRYDEILMDAIPEDFASPVLKALLTAEQGRLGTPPNPPRRASTIVR